MTRFEHYLSGKVFGIKYIFDTLQDGLPRHTHDASTAHNVCVLHGSVVVAFNDHVVYLSAGEIFDFDGSQWHSITATEPRTSILNVFLNGQPEEYKVLPASELKGEFDVRKFSQYK